jgi:hypothetical protein
MGQPKHAVTPRFNSVLFKEVTSIEEPSLSSRKDFNPLFSGRFKGSRRSIIAGAIVTRRLIIAGFVLTADKLILGVMELSPVTTAPTIIYRFSMVSLTLVINTKLQISPKFSKKFEMAPIGCSGSRGKLIREKPEVENLVSDFL